MAEEEWNEEEEALQEAEKARKHQKKKRRQKRMSLPQVLRYLTGDEVLELMDYLFQKHLEYVTTVETLRYTQAFDAMLNRYLTMTTQQTQTQETQTGGETGERNIVSEILPRPQNPLDMLLMNFLGKIADRLAETILTNPKFHAEIEELIKYVVASMAQQYAQENIAQTLSQQTINTQQQ